MDRPTQQIADYAASLTLDAIPRATRHDLRRRFVDTLACAVAALPTQPATSAHALAATAIGNPPARILLTGEPTTPDLAAYAGALMVRYWDWNDTYLHGGHPSDTIPAVLAIADTLSASGADVLVALAIAYETFCALSDAPNMLGTSSAGRIAISSAAAGARLLGSDHDSIANAVSLAAATTISRGVRGHGALSMWRAVQSAQGARGGVAAALAANHGIEGPLAPFAALGAPGDADLPGIGGRSGGSQLKVFPAEYHAQAAISAAVDLRQRIDPARIAGIVIATYAHAVNGIGSNPAMWEVPNLDTALHSAPYLVAVALTEGHVPPSRYLHEPLLNPTLRRLIDRTTVTEDPSYTAAYPTTVASRVEITLDDGVRLSAECRQPRVHTANLLTDDDLAAKLAHAAELVLSPDAVSGLAGLPWRIEDLPDLDWLYSLAPGDR